MPKKSGESKSKNSCQWQKVLNCVFTLLVSLTIVFVIEQYRTPPEASQIFRTVIELHQSHSPHHHGHHHHHHHKNSSNGSTFNDTSTSGSSSWDSQDEHAHKVQAPLAPATDDDDVDTKSTSGKKSDGPTTFVTHSKDETFILLHDRHLTNPGAVTIHTIVLTFSFVTKRRVLYHCPIIASGQGNNILEYQFARALAFWWNMEFAWVYPSTRKMGREKNAKVFEEFGTTPFIQQALEKRMLFSCVDQDDPFFTRVPWSNTSGKSRVSTYFPRTSTKTVNHFIADAVTDQKLSKKAIQLFLSEIDSFRNYFMVTMGKFQKSHIPYGGFPEPDDMEDPNSADLFMWFKKYRTQDWFRFVSKFPWGFQPSAVLYLHSIYRYYVAAPETKQAFLDYEREYLMKTEKCQKKPSKCKLSRIDNEFGPHDIAIHIRCGDIIMEGYPHAGFVNVKYYRAALQQIRDEFGVKKSDAKKAVFLINILDKKKDFANKEKSNFFTFKKSDHDMCRNMLNIATPGFKKVFEDEFGYKMKFLTDGTMNDDTYRLFVAPYVICSVSTFCTAPAVGNVKAKAIFQPSFNLAVNYNSMVDAIRARQKANEVEGDLRWNMFHIPTNKHNFLSCQIRNDLNWTVAQIGQFVGGTLDVKSADVPETYK